MAASVRGVSALQQELVKTKEHLHNVDENIKKLTGREPGDNRAPRRVPPGREEFKGRERLFAAARRGVVDEFGSPPAKRRAFGAMPPGRGALSRLGPRVVMSRVRPMAREDSGDEDEVPIKPALQSSVVVSDSKSRQDTIEQQNKDKAGKTRNRRMFGLLLGTLQRFKDEEKQKEDQDHKRKVVEQKLESKAIQEKEDLRRERSTLFNQRREQQSRLRRLEQKMELVEIHEDWEKQTKQLMNFIRTKAKPHIFFKPKLHHAGSDKKRRETCKILEDIIVDRRKQLEEEIDELTKLPEEKENLEIDNEKDEEDDEDARDEESMDVEENDGEEVKRRKHPRHADNDHGESIGRRKSHDRTDSDSKQTCEKKERHGSGEKLERRHRKKRNSTRCKDDNITEREDVSHIDVVASEDVDPHIASDDSSGEKGQAEIQENPQKEEEQTDIDSSILQSEKYTEPVAPTSTQCQSKHDPMDQEEPTLDELES